MLTRVIAFSVTSLFLLTATALAEKQPSNANLLDVTRVEFGAIPNDGLDDYPAIKLAMGIQDGFDGNTLYFPCGTYNFHETVEWRDWTGTFITPNPPNPAIPPGYAWTIGIPWEGERTDCVTIKLDDNSPGFNDPNNPKSFLMTGSLTGSNSSQKGLGGFQGNGAYINSISDLTVDCGSGNSGAKCVDWLASNAGELYRVKVKSGDGQGFAGVYLARQWPGPCMLYHVEIEGFNHGIYIRQNQYSITFLDVHVKNQLIDGVNVSANVGSFELFNSEQSNPAVPGFVIEDGGSQVAMINSSLTNSGTSSTRSAIETNASSKFLFYNISTSGYAHAVLKGGIAYVDGASVSQSISSTAYKLFNSPDRILGLPVEYPPDSYWVDPISNPESWANVLDYGNGIGNGAGGETNNDVAGIQAAMNSGRPIVYFPRLGVTQAGLPAGRPGIYAFKGPTITIPGTVRRVIFNKNSGFIAAANYPTLSDCVFTVIGESTDPPVEINLFRRSTSAPYPARVFCNLSNGRTMVIRNHPSSLSIRSEGPGKTFITDFIGGAIVKGGHHLWAWQLNQETGLALNGTANPSMTTVDGTGTTARMIGIKTEGDFTVAQVTNGAQYEQYTGWVSSCIGKTPINPVSSIGTIVDNAQASFSFLQHCGKNPAVQDFVYPTVVQQTIGTTTRTLKSTQTINQLTCCSNRNYMPLFVAYPNTDVVIQPDRITPGPGSVYMPFGLSSANYKMVDIDPSGVNGINMDPGMWTLPASCTGMDHATFTIQKLAEGTLDMSLYSCQQLPGGPLVGLFDPSGGSSAVVPRNCRHITRGVVVDGVSPNDTFSYEGSLGDMVARLNNCNGDCSAQVTLHCSR